MSGRMILANNSAIGAHLLDCSFRFRDKCALTGSVGHRAINGRRSPKAGPPADLKSPQRQRVSSINPNRNLQAWSTSGEVPAPYSSLIALTCSDR